MTDWSTISLLATAGGTLALAGATFASVRSANRAARATERALLAGIRPVLTSSRLQDPPEKVMFHDAYWVKVDGGRAAAEVSSDAIYLAVALRNVGNGLAVLDRWDLRVGLPPASPPPRDQSVFHRLTRDIYVSNGDLGFWQGALRDPTDPLFAQVSAAIETRQAMTLDLLYGDHEGGQRTITRFAILPGSEGSWLTAVSRHWNIDRADPR
jgi:hypothetical protein